MTTEEQQAADLRAARAAVAQARRGGSFPTDASEIGDWYLDSLVRGLPLWLHRSSGFLYLAANEAWPHLRKIGCTRRTVPERMRTLNSAGLAQPWVPECSWFVPDAYGLEARVHERAAQFRQVGELFSAPSPMLSALVQSTVDADEQRLASYFSPVFGRQFWQNQLQELAIEESIRHQRPQKSTKHSGSYQTGCGGAPWSSVLS